MRNKHARLAALVRAVRPGSPFGTPSERDELLAALEAYAPGHESLKLARNFRTALTPTVTAVREFLDRMVDRGYVWSTLRPYPLRDTILLCLAADLDDDARRRLRRCEDCRAIFYARRSNMRFCSRQCASRAALVRYATRGKSRG